MNSFMANPAKVERKWYVVDATGYTLGRLASEVAKVLRGKNKPIFTPHIDTGDYVVIINADKVAVTGGKETKKIYYKYTTGFVGSLKAHTFEKLLEKHPEDPIRLAVKGMLPHGRLGRVLMQNVKIYAGTDHPHTAQNPKAIEL